MCTESNTENEAKSPAMLVGESDFVLFQRKHNDHNSKLGLLVYVGMIQQLHSTW